ncbi:MAG: heme NO-binding domain-containing protein [Gemmatimonadaceae bacterium]|nr:heme NO-binding domain-containing protein [Gemmatimonadaceae bacterium]NUQ92997.1 heme NO-binding domain-containing protein [Gemmatimonadaceae bacterium]NUR18873.1 heme NO-binding domain-containing protein [Gemmatimonadaceae bacterium]NUS98530.1 heme NO-binding domain-containing protein [Gemmatimonadaceae bacterium]
MHGVIFAQLKKYADTKVGGDAWNHMRTAAGLGSRAYFSVQKYPDEELGALVAAASKLTGKPVTALLEDFGEFLVPELVRMYRSIIPAEWTALDLIEQTESRIHRVVRMNDAAASPPELRVRRLSPTSVLLDYRSPRRLCAVAKGIARGVGAHYNERLIIEERRCMHTGAPACEIVISRAA